MFSQSNKQTRQTKKRIPHENATERHITASAIQRRREGLRWTPKFGPGVKLDFRESVRDEKEQMNEIKTQTTQWGLQGQSRIRSAAGDQDGGPDCARVSNPSGAGKPVENGDSGTIAGVVRGGGENLRGQRTTDCATAPEDWRTDGGPGLA